MEDLRAVVRDYEGAERRMRQEVAEIKETHLRNEEEMQELLEERNRQFLQIEEIKRNEIDKLRRIVEELESKLSDEISDNLNCKHIIGQLQQHSQELS
jgi:hypothetical protein